MNLWHAMAISSSGLDAQRVTLEVIAGNLANAQTTRTEEGGPYLRRRAVHSPAPLPQRFADLFRSRTVAGGPAVKTEVVQDPQGVRIVHDPAHPDADEHGALALPNIHVLEEMIDLLRATRAYEANLTAFNAAKHMALKALEIGR